jgi:nucleoid DNA-binding protein
MNKNELAIEVSKSLGIPLKIVIPVINRAMEVVATTLLDDEPFNTKDLGSFYLKPHKQSVGYDPYHKKYIMRPEGMSLRFDPSASIRRRIRDRYDKGAVEIIENDKSAPEETKMEGKILVEA